MTTKVFSFCAISLLALITSSPAATVPAGSIVVVRTRHALHAVDAPGTPVPFTLVNNVTANGKVVLPAGAHINGKIKTSRRLVTSSQRLTVDLVSVNHGGRAVPIQTTGAARVDNENFKTLRGTPVGRTDYVVPVGRQLRFQLAQPLNL